MTRVVLLAGATGWVGSQLLPLLMRQGYRVRCLESWPEHLRGRVPEGVSLFRGDLHDADALAAAFAGVETAFYLVHAQSASREDADSDRRAAETFGAAAQAAGVRRLVYFGGFGSPPRPDGNGRTGDAGEALRTCGVPVTEFRASVILGAGGLCFEMLRAIVERTPVLPAPSWVRAPARPIAIDDVLASLLAAADLPPSGHRTFVLAGPDTVSYADLMREYARLRGLRRWVVPLPTSLPRLSSLWIATVAPDYARIGRRIIESLRAGTSGKDPGAPAPFPVPRPIGATQALARAANAEQADLTHTRWSRAVLSDEALHRWGGARYRNRFVDTRLVEAAAPSDAVFAAVEGIGNERGWYSPRWLWRLRGWMDRMVGGVGMDRRRRDSDRLAVGDVLDCWRVVAVDPGRRLLLSAEMKLPGHGWLEFEVRPGVDGRSTLRQTASFDPLGLTGLLYWWLLWPFHQLIFSQMARGLTLQAEWSARAATAPAAPGGGVAMR